MMMPYGPKNAELEITQRCDREYKELFVHMCLHPALDW